MKLGTAILAITDEPHRGCKKFSARFGPEALRWVNLRENRHLRLRGIHLEVLEAGRVSVGDTIEVLRSRPAKA
jgi:MOSC domain-containing protein YiiM